MFVVYATHPDGDDVKDSKLETYSQPLQELPQGVEKLAEGVWYLRSVEQLSFLNSLARAWYNSGLEFRVKGLSSSC